MNASKRVVAFRDRTFDVEILPDGRVQTAQSPDPFDVMPVGHGRYVVTGAGRQSLVYLAGRPDAPIAFFEGACYELEVRESGTRQPGRVTHELLESPMPATVVQILVDEGQRVEPGDTLLTLEAMKMQMPIRAPRSGVVSAIRCHVGELVQPGVPLIEIAEEA